MGPLEDDTSLVLRPELIQTFVRQRVGEMREKILRVRGPWDRRREAW